MRFTKPSVPAGTNETGGHSGIPSWRRKWLEEQVRLVSLECGHSEDLSIPTITFIDAFDGAEIDCVKCGKFVKVKRALKRKNRSVNPSDVPLF